MKKLHFDEKLESLVDIQGVKYEGKRFKTVNAWCTSGYPTLRQAEKEVYQKLEELAGLHGANAYEVIYMQTFDSHQEYDNRPYTATASAILYKSK